MQATNNGDRADVAKPPSAVRMPTSSPFVMLDAEQERLEAYAREQFEHIRQEKQALAGERKAMEQALTTRREELERQMQSLLLRLQEVRDREERAAEATGDGAARDIETLRQQLHEQQCQVELLQAERDAAWAQLNHLREQQLRQLEQIEEKHNAALGQQEDVQRLEKERGMLLNRLEELEQAEQHRQTAQRQLDELRQRLSVSDEDVDLAGSLPGDKLVETYLPIGIYQQQLFDLQAERDALAAELGRSRDRLHSLEPVLADRDELLRKVHHMCEQPDDWADYEAEFNLLRRQLIDERRHLNEDFQASMRRHAELQRELEAHRVALDEERRQLEGLRRPHERPSAGAEAFEVREAELRGLQRELRLQEAEIRELRDIAERELAEHRADLTRERLQLAREWESLRLEREEAGLDGRTVPPS
jgi:chromosome segregation ATPase